MAVYDPVGLNTNLLAINRFWNRFRQRKDEWPGLAILSFSVLFTAVHAAPELWIGRLPVNDASFHLAAVERLVKSASENEAFLNPWVSEWGLGYPVWTSYQPLPHIVAALCFRTFSAIGSPESIFAALSYLFLVCLPISIYGGARLLGLPALAAGLAGLMVYATSGIAPYCSYGLGYGALVWRGTGLYTQLVALHFFCWTLGICRRALDWSTHRWLALGSLGVCLTLLSHIILGYVVYVSVALLICAAPAAQFWSRFRRGAVILLSSLLLQLWFIVPLVLDREVVNHSVWEQQEKWDSYGAVRILPDLMQGNFWDAGRLPILTVIVVLGWLFLLLLNRRSTVTKFFGFSTAFWLLLFFGRTTWGHWVKLAAIPADLHMHRLQVPFELFAFLGASLGLAHFWVSVSRYKSYVSSSLLALSAVSTVLVFHERSIYLAQNRDWGEQNLATFTKESAEVEEVVKELKRLLAQKPGRVDAGQASTYSSEMRVGSALFASILSRDHLDQVSFLFHSMSKAGDLIYFRTGQDAAQDDLLGVRCVVAPAHRSMPSHLKKTTVIGKYAVYESSMDGYWSTTDLIPGYKIESLNGQPLAQQWLRRVAAEGSAALVRETWVDGPRSASLVDFPVLYSPAYSSGRPGNIVHSAKSGEVYRATVQMTRSAYALLKVTWNPHWIVKVDGKPQSVRWVYPGFAAVAVQEGIHEVEYSFEPGLLRPVLLLLGALLWLAWSTSPSWIPGYKVSLR